MGKKTRALTLSALLSALCILTLYAASLWPTGQPGFAAVASLFVAAAVIEAGLGPALSVFIVSSALSMLLLPVKSAAIMFALFFGYYPVVKNLVERLKRKIWQWALKLLIFYLAATVLVFVIKTLIFSFTDKLAGVILLYTGGSAVFLLFDYGYTKVIAFYKERVNRAGATRRG